MNSIGAMTTGRPLAGDFKFQADFVIDAAWRMMAMQDTNPNSPSFGCFHYAYWRDKTSEFPDARFQEAGAALALLAAPAFDAARHQGRLASEEKLLGAFSAAVRNWARQQDAQGAFDEWYKGERGFAATAFTTVAYGLAAYLLKDRLPAADRARLVEVVGRASDWLIRRTDRTKANHEATGAAALALGWKLTGEDRFLRAAKVKLESTLKRQQPEGWFPEVGGMDLGYCSVLLDYVMIYALVTGDHSADPAMARLFDFMQPLIHPDATISAEMGLCFNPYVSRLGLGLLSQRNPGAARLIARLEKASPERSGLTPYLADDLRLVRWSYLPLATALLLDQFGVSESAPAEDFKPGWTWYPQAAVGAHHDRDFHVYVSAAGGGVVRAFLGSRLVYEDLGVSVVTSDERYTTRLFNPDQPVTRSGSAVTLVLPMQAPQFNFPGFLSRLILRVGCTTPLGSRLLRSLIDFIRVKRRTAGNQSAAGSAKRASPLRVERVIAVDDRVLAVHDRLINLESASDPSAIAVDITVDGQECRPDWRVENGALSLSRSIRPSENGAVHCDWNAAEARKNQ